MKHLESSLSDLSTRVPGFSLGLSPRSVSLHWLPAAKRTKKQALPDRRGRSVDVVQKDVPIYYEWVATLDGFVNATIRAQVTVPATWSKQNYGDGDLVKKGQVLFEIDPEPLRLL